MSIGAQRNPLRRTFMLLIAGACLAAAPAALAQASSPPESALTPEQKTAVEHVIHDYLLSHPEVMMETLQAAKEQQQQHAEEHAQQALKTRHDEIFDDPASPVGGNLHGDVSIVEFFDYRCPYCKRVQPSIEAMLKEDAGLRIVYKEFPILGAPSVLAARVALAARKQGKYDAFHKAMMATPGEAEIDEKVVMRVARSAGLDLDRLKADMRAPEIAAVLRHNYELAEALSINGTPGIIIGDEILHGAADIETMRRAVATARKPR
jgi:protein-disulfide isomerase